MQVFSSKQMLQHGLFTLRVLRKGKIFSSDNCLMQEHVKMSYESIALKTNIRWSTNVAVRKKIFNKVKIMQVAKRQVKQIMQEFVKTTND